MKHKWLFLLLCIFLFAGLGVAQIQNGGGGSGPTPDGNAGHCWVGTGAWASCGSASMTWPSTPGIVACTGTPCTAYGTSIAWDAGTSTMTGNVTGNAATATSVSGACIPGSFAAQTDAGTVTWAIASSVCANGSLLFTTHGGSRTLNLTGLVNGGSYVLKITQDSVGGEGLTLGSGCAWKVSSGGGGAITPSTGANAIDVLAFTYDGTNCLANFATNFN